MSKETNKCDWCKNKTNMPNSFVAMSPIQPKMEKKIQEAVTNYGNEWWVELEKNNPKLMDELTFSSISFNIFNASLYSTFCIICYYMVSTGHIITMFCYHFKYFWVHFN